MSTSRARVILCAAAAGLAAASVLASINPPADPPKPAEVPASGVDPQAAKEQAEASIKAATAALKAQPEITVPPPPKAIPIPDMPVVETKTLESGIVVEDMKIGDGYEVKADGAVVAHYHGTLKADPAKVFDSSFTRGEPAAFALAQVIPGWQQGVPGMKLGGIRRLTIPAAMGYGERGAGTDIPPNADLVFIIQLVDALQVIDVKVGTGEEAAAVCVAVAAHTYKDAEGKVIESSEASKPYIWIPGEHQGINAGITGMKVGGKRTIKIPADFNVSPPQAKRTTPQNVPAEIEIELITVRNLQ
jgi:FKBP-type peptidyl-prolyl cis-trans isomerase